MFWNPEYFNVIVETFGYIGVFIVSLAAAATIFFPLPGFVIIPVGAHFLNPLLVALVGAVGSAIGELVAYWAGRGGRVLAKLEYEKFTLWSSRLERWFERMNGFVIIILFAATPLPHDVVGIFAGVIKYDIKKFFLATLIGKFVMFCILAYGFSLLFP